MLRPCRTFVLSKSFTAPEKMAAQHDWDMSRERDPPAMIVFRPIVCAFFLIQHSLSLVTCFILFTMHGRVRQVRTFEDYRLSECASLTSSVLYSLVLQTWLANTRTGWRNVAPKKLCSSSFECNPAFFLTPLPPTQ